MTFGLIFILSIFGLASIETESWQCRNDVEVHCAEGKCDAKKSGEFTPMSVSFDGLGKMSVCAYTGCWEGVGKVSSSDNFMILNGQNLKFSTSDMKQNIAIILDKTDNVATLKAGSFAQPLVCEKKRLK